MEWSGVEWSGCSHCPPSHFLERVNLKLQRTKAGGSIKEVVAVDPQRARLDQQSNLCSSNREPLNEGNEQEQAAAKKAKPSATQPREATIKPSCFPLFESNPPQAPWKGFQTTHCLPDHSCWASVEEQQASNADTSSESKVGRCKR